MNYYALIVGIAVAVYVVIRFKKRKLENIKWVYPAFLATFPVYYWVFAVYASDYKALISEVAIGSGFLLVAYIAYKLNSFMGLVILATGYIAHAVYDAIHNSLFYNPGTPGWWPEFCGSVDILIGLYLLYFALSIKKEEVENA